MKASRLASLLEQYISQYGDYDVLIDGGDLQLVDEYKVICVLGLEQIRIELKKN